LVVTVVVAATGSGLGVTVVVSVLASGGVEEESVVVVGVVVASKPTTANSLEPADEEAAGVFEDAVSPEPKRPGNNNIPFFLLEQANKRRGMVRIKNIFFMRWFLVIVKYTTK